jgi:hypothetical protein
MTSIKARSGRDESQQSLKKKLIKNVIGRRLTEAIADANTLVGDRAMHHFDGSRVESRKRSFTVALAWCGITDELKWRI